MKFKVGDEVAYIEDGGLVIGVATRAVEDRREKDRFVDNLYAVNNQYKYESDLIPSPIAKINERIAMWEKGIEIEKRLKMGEGLMDREYRVLINEDKTILSFLRGESK